MNRIESINTQRVRWCANERGVSLEQAAEEAGLLFPLQEKLKRHDSLSVRRALEQSQWLSPDEIAGLQLRRLRQFLRNRNSCISQRLVQHQVPAVLTG